MDKICEIRVSTPSVSLCETFASGRPFKNSQGMIKEKHFAED